MKNNKELNEYIKLIQEASDWVTITVDEEGEMKFFTSTPDFTFAANVILSAAEAIKETISESANETTH